MSSYVDDGEWLQHQRASVLVHEEPRAAKVTFRGDGASKFSVIVRQKPNPIGFAAKLPGDKR